MALCSTASMSFSHILLDEHASAELVVVDEPMCQQLWMLAVLLWRASGSDAARQLRQACAAALTCCLLSSHPTAVLGLDDPVRRCGMDFVPVEMKQLQHTPSWYPSSDGSSKRQLSSVLACAASAFDFDNEFVHIKPAEMAVGSVLLLLEGDDISMMQRALNALQVRCGSSAVFHQICAHVHVYICTGTGTHVCTCAHLHMCFVCTTLDLMHHTGHVFHRHHLGCNITRAAPAAVHRNARATVVLDQTQRQGLVIIISTTHLPLQHKHITQSSSHHAPGSPVRCCRSRKHHFPLIHTGTSSDGCWPSSYSCEQH